MSSGGPRRVVVCFHEPHLGGATRSVERIVPSLEARGWEFSFWVPRPSDLYDELSGRGWDVDGEARAIEYSVRAWRLPPGARRRLGLAPGYLRRFRRFLDSRRPALVHANSILTLAEGLSAARRGVPTLLHVHEMLPDRLRSKVMRHLAWRSFDAVVAVSNASAAPLALPGRMPLLVHEAAPVPERPVEIRPDPHPFMVGTVAVVSSRKGSDLFVEAARRLSLPGSRRDFGFEMVGAANDELERAWAAELLDRARAVGIEHTPVADVQERFAGWDAFVLPSRADPFPIALLEAMAAGLPVIGSRRDGLAEQIAPGTGILCAPEDPGALAHAIAALAAEPQAVRRAMGEKARRRIEENFTLAHQAEAMDRAYRSALSRAGGAPTGA